MVQLPVEASTIEYALKPTSFPTFPALFRPYPTAKPIVSLPPFMVIIFELTILMGALATLLGLLINSRLRRNVPTTMYDTRFSEDKFGVMITCEKENVKDAEEILTSQGAEDIKFDGV